MWSTFAMNQTKPPIRLDTVAKILVAEDDQAIAERIVRMLERSGYEIKYVSDGREVLKHASAVDLLLLDLGLPGRDGLDICRDVRAQGLTLPIIIVSARTEEIDLILGLDAGADDYVTKPFSSAELQARIRAALRRHQTPTLLAVGQLVLDPGNHEAAFGDRLLQLTPKEFALLELLMRRSPQVVTREELLRGVWETDWMGASKTIDMHVSTLRKKLQEAGARRDVISTVRGVGFRCTRP